MRTFCCVWLNLCLLNKIQQQRTEIGKSVNADTLGWPITQCESEAHTVFGHPIVH